VWCEPRSWPMRKCPTMFRFAPYFQIFRRADGRGVKLGNSPGMQAEACTPRGQVVPAKMQNAPDFPPRVGEGLSWRDRCETRAKCATWHITEAIEAPRAPRCAKEVSERVPAIDLPCLSGAPVPCCSGLVIVNAPCILRDPPATSSERAFSRSIVVRFVTVNLIRRRRHHG